MSSHDDEGEKERKGTDRKGKERNWSGLKEHISFINEREVRV